MKLVVLGATGPSGQALVAQALEADHEVTAIVRSAARMTITHANLKVSITETLVFVFVLLCFCLFVFFFNHHFFFLHPRRNDACKC